MDLYLLPGCQPYTTYMVKILKLGPENNDQISYSEAMTVITLRENVVNGESFYLIFIK